MRRAHADSRLDHQEIDLPIWTEALFTAELLLLHASPIYYGFGVPRGNGSAVVLIPGFLCPDACLMPLRSWLGRIGYNAYYSGIGFNADCPNLLIQQQLNETMENALNDTGQKVHLVGHSLGGIIARSIAAQRPDEVASVVTLGAPVRRMVAHGSILRAAERTRLRIMEQHGDGVSPDCYTGRCTCDFVTSAHRRLPASVLETAIYTESDGIVDWRCCKTNNCSRDFAVHGTHIGLPFNPEVYTIISSRLAEAESLVA